MSADGDGDAEYGRGRRVRPRLGFFRETATSAEESSSHPCSGVGNSTFVDDTRVVPKKKDDNFVVIKSLSTTKDGSELRTDHHEASWSAKSRYPTPDASTFQYVSHFTGQAALDRVLCSIAGLKCCLVVEKNDFLREICAHYLQCQSDRGLVSDVVDLDLVSRPRALSPAFLVRLLLRLDTKRVLQMCKTRA